MNALVVYFTKFGNTQSVAETIAAALAPRYDVRALSLDALTPTDLRSADLVVVGSPTHNMNLPKPVRPLLEALPKRIIRKGTPVAAFDTSYKMSPWLNAFTAAKKLGPKLRKLGGRLVVPPETFLVMEREGPLYEGEIERAEAWAGAIAARLNGG